MHSLHVIGGGPAGASAVISALHEGARVELFEKSTFPRHKVCGEFLSPEIAPLLEHLCVQREFEALAPARLARIHLTIGASQKRWQLTEPAYGLSRFALDHMLLQHAANQGATVRRESCSAPHPPAVLAHGRKAGSRAGSRLFGFKAHFSGPVTDSVDLFFFSGCYAGVSAIEHAQTNVCGLAPEKLLRERNFQIESLIPLSPAFAERLAPLTKTMDWLITGPLIFRDSFRDTFRTVPKPAEYLAGDALGFVDPFTGSGILAAIATGTMAGIAAARHSSVETYLADCKELLSAQYGVAALFRLAIQCGVAERFAPLLPGKALFAWTRPHFAESPFYKKSR